jgi:methionyl-tRNA formyltransferase
MRPHVYLVAGCKPWNRRLFDEVIRRFPGRWAFAASPAELARQAPRLKPRYIFFLHWSWKVPESIIQPYECIAFHMTDLPYGRGGSPLQNLVVRGHRHTRLSALRMTESFDAGPIYLKRDLPLSGTAEEILIHAGRLSAQMIREIITAELQPKPQQGKPVMFKRRKPEQSRIPRRAELAALHDFIRMLDAEGYPRAFLVHKGFRYEFSRAALYDGRIVADVTITPAGEAKP